MRLVIKRISGFPSRRYGVFTDSGEQVGKAFSQYATASKFVSSIHEVMDSGWELVKKDSK